MCDFDEAKQVTHEFAHNFHRNQELQIRDARQKKTWNVFSNLIQLHCLTAANVVLQLSNKESHDFLPEILLTFWQNTSILLKTCDATTR